MLATVSFYFKWILILLWFFIATIAFTLLAVICWGNTTVSWAYAHSMGWVAMKILGIRVRVMGRERLTQNGPCIIVANHQSNFDLFLYGTLLPLPTVIIGKKEVRRIPFFGILLVATKNILIDRQDREKAVAGLEKAVRALQEHGVNIFIFPEGTRSKGRGLGPFKKGAFHMAVAAGVPLVPVVTQPLETVLDERKHRIYGGEIEIRVLEPISTKGCTVDDVNRLLTQTHNLYRQELSSMGAVFPNAEETPV